MDTMQAHLWGGDTSTPTAKRNRFVALVSMVLALVVIIILMAASRKAKWGKTMSAIGASVSSALLLGLVGIMVFGGFQDTQVKAAET